MSASWAIQEGIYNNLISNTTLSNYVNSRIYDEPPTNETYPYILIGDDIENNDNRLAKKGYESYSRIYIHTKIPDSMGFKQSKLILSYMNQTLNAANLTLNGFNCSMCTFYNSTPERNGDYRILWATYKIKAHEDNLIFR